MFVGGSEDGRMREKRGGGREGEAARGQGGLAKPCSDQTGFPQLCRIVRKAARIEPSRPECGLIDLSCFCGGIYLAAN